MRMIITGLDDGRTCVAREIEIAHQGAELSAVRLLDLALDPPPVIPEGRGQYKDFGIPLGDLRWLRARFPANQRRPLHYTNTIDFHTIVAGWIELLLDDGAHRLSPGDSALVTGVDHGWLVGPEGCESSIIQIGTPGPMVTLS
jgi:hypothetical protein